VSAQLVHDAKVDRFEAGKTWSHGHFVAAPGAMCALVFAPSGMTLQSFLIVPNMHPPFVLTSERMHDVFCKPDPREKNRLKAKCNALGVDYSAITDMLSRMLRWSPELDWDGNFAPTRTADDTDYDAEANTAASKVLRELAAEYGLSHREAALLILDTWSGPPDTLPGDYRGKGTKYPFIINLQNEHWEIVSTAVI
jgi:hypothetical protein